jgi:hypothetical protein
MTSIDELSGDVSSDDSRLLVEAMRHIADQQVERAERVRTSARQTFAYLTGVFTVAQAGTLAAFAHQGMPEWAERATLVLALVTVVCLGVGGFFVIRTERLKVAPEIAPWDVTRVADEAEETGEPVGDALALLYAERIEKQGKAIDERRAPLDVLTAMAFLTIFFLILEVGVALVGRFA